ncbi:MAG: CoA-binding protein [Acidimicrobiaceae bacterium]|nr:CoA-binding protein [Acidimicrobiaceae bacterium]|tara:strand:+ start:238 stop:624 length:387 start_codon:yes stop_codon:yes gene_type:complete
MLDLVKDKRIKVAIIGATNNSSKYGYKIYKNLLSKGYSVTPINPKETIIEGIETIPSVLEMSSKPNIIDFVVPPSIALSEAKLLEENGYNNFWFQPGSESDALIKYLENTNLNYVINQCIMVETESVK